jgi:hypothetical protein
MIFHFFKQQLVPTAQEPKTLFARMNIIFFMHGTKITLISCTWLERNESATLRCVVLDNHLKDQNIH